LALVTAAALVLIAVVAIFMLSTPEPAPREAVTTGPEPEAAPETVARRPEAITKGAPKEFKGKAAPATAEGLEKVAQEQVAQTKTREEYEKKENLEELNKALRNGAEKAGELAALPKPARVEAEKEFGFTQRAKQEAEEPLKLDKANLRRRLQDFAKNLGKREEELEPSAAERLAKLPKKAPSTGQAGGALAPDKLAQTPGAPDSKMHRGQAGEAVPLVKDEKPEADAGEALTRIEEIELITPNIALTAGAVRELLAQYEARTAPDDADTSKEQEGAPGKAEEPDAESVILVVQIDSRHLRELLDRLDTLEAPEQLESGRAEVAKDEERARRTWGGASGKGAPAAGKPAGPSAAPVPPPAEEFSEKEDGTGQEKQALKKAEDSQKKASKKLTQPEEAAPAPRPGKLGYEKEKKTDREELEEAKKKARKAPVAKVPAEAPSDPAQRRDKKKAPAQFVTLRIRIVRSELPAAKLPELKEKAAKPEPTPGK
jgi:hypothetical protein